MKNIRLTNEEISAICRELGLLIHGGINIADGLLSMAENEETEEMKGLLTEMGNKADDGYQLGQIFREAGCFPEYVTGILEVSDRTGGTEEALLSLGTYYENRVRTERHIRSAVLYPAVLLFIMLIIIVVLLTKVLPVFNDVYAQLGAGLSGVAGGLMALGSFLDKAMPVLLVILAAAVVLIILFAASQGFRDKAITWWKKTRGDKGIAAQISNARFAQVLSMGMRAGLDTQDILKLSENLFTDSPYELGCLKTCGEKLDSGMTLIEALNDSGLIPKSQTRLINVGNRAGRGDEVMADVAARMTEESENALEDKVSKIEPALVIATSILVGLILLSVMLPLVHIMSAIG